MALRFFILLILGSSCHSFSPIPVYTTYETTKLRESYWPNDKPFSTDDIRAPEILVSSNAISTTTTYDNRVTYDDAADISQ